MVYEVVEVWQAIGYVQTIAKTSTLFKGALENILKFFLGGGGWISLIT